MVDRVPQADEFEMPMIRYQATQMFPWPGKLPLMRSAVEKQQEAAGADVDVRRFDRLLDAKRAFYVLALNAPRREIDRASRSLATTIADAPEMKDCPLGPRGVSARVTGTESGFAVSIRGEDVATAQEVLRRARALVSR
jgi:hypothetical protein